MMFVLNPDPFLIPSFRISPFQTRHIASNAALPEDDFADRYFNERFGNNKWEYTLNGREAIKIALESYHLKADDRVTILTTSENHYISSCVTNEIELACCWNRELTPKTKIIFVNHEFGYPHGSMEELVQNGIPVIEDCCTTFFSQDKSGKTGSYGDYAVYSFPKFFPLQIGGLVVSNSGRPLRKSRLLNENEMQYIRRVLSHYLRNQAELLVQRRENFKMASTLFSGLGFNERFEKNEKITPSVLLLNNNAIIKDLNDFKIFLGRNGIQSSIFYGEDAFFIPVHQSLNATEINYMHFITSEYLKNNNQ